MNKRQELSYSSRNYSSKQLYPVKKEQKNDCDDEYYPGGKFSYSEVGGPAQDQQNPWQGSQERWEQI